MLSVSLTSMRPELTLRLLFLHTDQIRPCEVEVVRDVAGLHVNAEPYGGYAGSARWEFFASYHHNIMIRSMLCVHNAVDTGYRSHLTGTIGTAKRARRSGGSHRQV